MSKMRLTRFATVLLGIFSFILFNEVNRIYTCFKLMQPPYIFINCGDRANDFKLFFVEAVSLDFEID